MGHTENTRCVNHALIKLVPLKGICVNFDSPNIYTYIYIYIWDNAWLVLLMHEGGDKEPPDTKPCIIPFIPFASIDKLKLSIMFSVQNVTGRLKLYFKTSVFRLFY